MHKITLDNGKTYAAGTETEAVLGHDARDFPHKDARGRVIGGRVTFLTVTYRALDDAEVAANAARFGGRYCGSIIEPEKIGRTFYAIRPHALRDGEAFGALQARRFFDTKDEMQAAAVKYFADAEKRAGKRK